MKKLHLILLIAAAIVVIAGSITWALIANREHDLKRVSPAFREYVQAYTAGIVSGHTTVKVRLTDDFADSAMLSIPLQEKLFSFSPSIAGKTCWSDSRTIEFIPDAPLPQGKTFEVQFYLSRIIPVPDSLKTMEFGFRTMEQEIGVTAENHKAYNNDDLTREFLTGSLLTSDFADDQLIEKTIVAKQNGNALPVTWSHDRKNRSHVFQVDSIKRENSEGTVTLQWNGSPVGSASEGELRVEIPALNTFKVVGVRSMPEAQNTLMIRFSDPLRQDQNLDGLFRVGRLNNLRYAVDDNILWIYLPETQEGKMKLTLEPTIRNCNQVPLGKLFEQDVILENNKPNVRFTGDGVIMPGTNKMLLPFETVNLNAIDIRVVRVFEKNILQFLQVNDLGTNAELARVGRIVLQKTMPLQGITDYGKWTRQSIDLGTLIKAEPGAIYSVILGFKKSYSTYPCGDSATLKRQVTDMVFVGDAEQESEKEWGYYSNYWDDDYADGGWRNYNWEERENPCKPSYYFNRTISRNVIASDLGMIAKAGDDGSWNVFVTDLITAKPLSGIPVEFFNLQLQSMGKASTDSKGMAVIALRTRPFVLVARSGEQSAYLKLGEGNALSLSMFDVGGEPVQKGIKGFIYGERGVWRPGDSIFLNFILEDKFHNLPANHPVGFSLVNPSGQTMARLVKTQSVGGFYNFRTATSPDAPTGNWLAKVTVGGVDFQKFLKIETVKPNRLKINFNFPKDYLVKDQIEPVVLKASWLTGANAGALKSKVMLTLTRSVTAFKGFPGYTFDNPTAGFAAENVTVFDGRLDASGQATITPKIHVTHIAPGALKASFETMVFEEGGDFSVDRFSIPFYPYQTYAGLSVPYNSANDRVLFTDKDYAINLVNVSAAGSLVPSNRLKVEVYKLEWRWWWDNSESGSANYISTAYLRASDSAVISTRDGKATYSFRVGYDDWGRYLVKVTDTRSGHAAGQVVYVDWPGYFRMPGGEKQAASMLTMTLDKSRYRTGEKVKLMLPASPEGKALVSIETGSKVLKSFWVDTQKGSTSVEFTATAEMVPNCYASVTLLQPHAQTGNDLPIRLYGTVPVFVENPGTHLKPLINMPAVWTPGKEVTISVKESDGKALTYTLAVVDDGLLDLTRFKTPDPWNVFYAREALGIKTWDLFDQVMGAYSGELQRILSIGGDQEGEIKGSLKANRFKAMVRFFGPVELKNGQQNKHTFKVPEYTGSVRVMVVAGRDGSYGNDEKNAVVKKPLMVLGTLPRVLCPGETVKLPVSVFAMEKGIRNVRVELVANEFFSVSGGAVRNLNFTATGDQLATFDLQVAEMAGVGKVRIVATSGKETAEYEIGVDVRNPNPRVASVLEKVIQPGSAWKADYQPAGMAGTNRGVLEISSIPSLNFENRLNYLIRYPYGCLEQTVSAAFPQLYAADILEVSQSSQKEIQQNITAAIQRIRSFQVPQGGLALWPGSNYPDDWVTSYAGHFMLEAEQKGYALPLNLMSAWKEFQRQKAVSWSWNQGYFNNDLVQAYRLFTLALAKVPELGAMNKLLEQRNLSTAARIRLAAAYQLAGMPETATRLIGTLPLTIKPYQELSDTYGSDLRDKAMVTEALCIMNMKTKAAPLAIEISKALSSSAWYSTQSTSFALLSLTKFLSGSQGTGINAAVSQNRAMAEELVSKKQVIDKKITVAPDEKGVLEVTNKGKNVLYGRLVLTGIPAVGDTTRLSRNLNLNVATRTLAGASLNVSTLEQGTNFIVEVTVSNPGLRGSYRQMALSLRVPSGWEIINSRNSAWAQSLTSEGTYTYQDIRDDRVDTFFDLEPSQSKTFRILMMATYTGRFYLPATSCQAMYDESISAWLPGRWVTVVPGTK